jgi:sugar/nucleoside kinase (ribokinase family)
LRSVGGADFLSWVRAADLLLANTDEALALLDRAPAGSGGSDDAAALAVALSTKAGQMVVKAGPGGAVWAAGDALLASCPAAPATAVDPTGAGDAFAAGLLASWLDGRDPVAALAAGARLGAEAVGRVGARPG